MPCCSAILAETEIQRQVKVAYLKAAEKAILPSGMHYIFQKALKAGKMIRNQLAVAKSVPSLQNTIFRLAENFFGTCLDLQVLFVGYSELNRGLASFFLRKGMVHLTFCTKEPESIQYPGCKVVGRDALERWDVFDLIVCASKAGGYLIHKTGDSRRLIFDLSVPRNVDPGVGQTSQVYNIEQINSLIETDGLNQQSDLARSETVIKQYVVQLARIYRNKQEIRHSLEIGMAGVSRKGDYISNIFHARGEENEALKS